MLVWLLIRRWCRWLCWMTIRIVTMCWLSIISCMIVCIWRKTKCRVGGCHRRTRYRMNVGCSTVVWLSLIGVIRGGGSGMVVNCITMSFSSSSTYTNNRDNHCRTNQSANNNSNNQPDINGFFFFVNFVLLLTVNICALWKILYSKVAWFLSCTIWCLYTNKIVIFGTPATPGCTVTVALQLFGWAFIVKT